MPNMKSLSLFYGSEVMAIVKVFRHVGQRPRSRSQVQTFWYQGKGLITWKAHVKCQSPSSICSKVVAKVKVHRNVGQRSR